MKADKESLAACPGIGPTKVDRLHDAFNLPFKYKKKQSGKESGFPSKETALNKEN